MTTATIPSEVVYPEGLRYRETGMYHYLLRQKANGREIKLPNWGLYPCLEIEQKSDFDREIESVWETIKYYSKVHEAMGIINEMQLHVRLDYGRGGNHIWFCDMEFPNERLAIIYFDPYKI